MKAIKKIIATAICLMMVMGLCICNPVSATEEPLLTVAFMSDLHNQQVHLKVEILEIQLLKYAMT